MSEPLTKKRVRNPAQTRMRLLQATIGLIAGKGDDAVTLKEAARLAGLSRTAAYQHFTDREDLLREAKSSLSERLMISLLGIGTLTVEGHVEQATRVVLENPEASQLLITDALTGRSPTTDHPLFLLVRQSLAKLIESGEIRDEVDLDMLTFIMIGVVPMQIMLSHWREGGNLDERVTRFSAEWTRILRQGIFR